MDNHYISMRIENSKAQLYMAGWWFGTLILFSPIAGMMIQSANPIYVFVCFCSTGSAGNI